MKKFTLSVYTILLLLITTQTHAFSHKNLRNYFMNINNGENFTENIVVMVDDCEAYKPTSKVRNKEYTPLKKLKFLYFSAKNGAELLTNTDDNVDYILMTTKLTQFDDELNKTVVTASLSLSLEDSLLVYQTNKDGHEETVAYICDSDAINFL